MRKIGQAKKNPFAGQYHTGNVQLVQKHMPPKPIILEHIYIDHSSNMSRNYRLSFISTTFFETAAYSLALAYEALFSRQIDPER